MAAVGVTVPLHGSCAPSLQARKVRSGKTRAVKTEPPSWDERVDPQLGENMIRLLIVNGILHHFTTALLNTLEHSYHCGFPSSSKLSERKTVREKQWEVFKKKSQVHHPWVANLSPATTLRCQLIAFGDIWCKTRFLWSCFRINDLSQESSLQVLLTLSPGSNQGRNSGWFGWSGWSPRHTPSESQVSICFYEQYLSNHIWQGNKSLC